MADNEIKIKFSAETEEAVSKFAQLGKYIKYLTEELQKFVKQAELAQEVILKGGTATIAPKKETYKIESKIKTEEGEVPLTIKTTIPTQQAIEEAEAKRLEAETRKAAALARQEEKKAREELKRAQAEANALAREQARLERERVKALTEEASKKEQILNIEQKLYLAGYSRSAINKKINELTKAEGLEFDALVGKTNRLTREYTKNKQLQQDLLRIQAQFPKIFDKVAGHQTNINGLTIQQKQQLLDNLKVEIAHEKAREKATASIHSMGFALIRLGSVLKQIGSIGIAAVSGLIRETINFNLQVYRLSTGLNIPIQDVGRLGFIAESTGVSIDALTKGMGNYYQALLRAGQGTSMVAARVREALEAVGIAPKKLGEVELKSTIEQLEDIRAVYQKLTQAQDKAYLGQLIFGGAYEQFIPLLNMSNEQFKKMMDTFDRMFPNFASGTEDMISKITEINSLITAWRYSIRLLGGDLLQSLQPTLEDISKVLVNLLDRFNDLSPSTKEAISKFALFAPFILLVSGFILQLAGNVLTLSNHLGWLKTCLKAIVTSPILGSIAGIAIAFTKLAWDGYVATQRMNDAERAIKKMGDAFNGAKSTIDKYADALEKAGKKTYYDTRLVLLQTRAYELQTEIVKLRARDWDTLVKYFGKVGALANKIVPVGIGEVSTKLESQANEIAKKIKATEAEIEKIGKGATGTGLNIQPSEEAVSKEVSEAIKKIKLEAKAHNLTITETIEKYNVLLKKYKDNEQILAEINALEEERKRILEEVDNFIKELTYRESTLPEDYKKINDLLEKRGEILKKLATEGSEEGKKKQIELEEIFNQEILNITTDALDKKKNETLKSEKDLILAKESLSQEDVRRIRELNELLYQSDLERLEKSHNALLKFIDEKVAPIVQNEKLINDLKLAEEESYNQQKLTIDNAYGKQEIDLTDRVQSDRNKIIEKYEKEFLTDRLEGLRQNAKYQEESYEGVLKIYSDFIKQLNSGMLGEFELTKKEQAKLLAETKQKTYGFIKSQVDETIKEFEREGKSVRQHYNEIFDSLIKKFPDLENEINEVRDYFYKTEIIPQVPVDKALFTWQNMLEDLRKSTANTFLNMGNLTADFFENFTSSFADAFDKALFEGENFFDTFCSLLHDFTRRVIKEIVDMLMQKAVMWFIGLFIRGAGGGGGASNLGDLNLGENLFAEKGLLLQAKEGALLPSFKSGGIPIMAHPGELVVPQWKTNQLISSLRTEKGETTASPVNINFNINAIDTQTGIDFLLKNRSVIASSVQASLKENHPLRRS